MTIELPGTQEDQEPETPDAVEVDTGGEPDGQDPQKAVSPSAKAPARGVPPPDFEDRMMRLLKARADAMQTTRFDDRGRVRRVGIESQDEAMREAAVFMSRYATGFGNGTTKNADKLRAYFDGGELPNDFVPRVDVIKSEETQNLEWRAQLGREQSPVLAAVRDYVVDPIGNILPAAGQVFADTYAGLANLAGADIKPWDVKASIHSLGGLAGDTAEKAAELQMAADTASTGSSILRGAGEFAGMAAGMFGGGGVGAAGKTAATVGGVAKAAALAPSTILRTAGAVGGKVGGGVGG